MAPIILNGTNTQIADMLMSNLPNFIIDRGRDEISYYILLTHPFNYPGPFNTRRQLINVLKNFRGQNPGSLEVEGYVENGNEFAMLRSHDSMNNYRILNNEEISLIDTDSEISPSSSVYITPNSSYSSSLNSSSQEGNSAMSRAISNNSSIDIPYQRRSFESADEAYFREWEQGMTARDVDEHLMSDMSGLTEDIERMNQDLIHRALMNNPESTTASSSTNSGIHSNGPYNIPIINQKYKEESTTASSSTNSGIHSNGPYNIPILKSVPKVAPVIPSVELPVFQKFACAVGDEGNCNYNFNTIGEVPGLNRYIANKPQSSYPASINAEIKLLSVSLDSPAIPVGSANYRIQQFPGDVDLMEVLVGCCTPQAVIHQFIQGVKRIIRKIDKLKLHYYSEIKAGVDRRYDVNIGELADGKYTPGVKLIEEIQSLFSRNMIRGEDYNMIMNTLKNNNGADAYDLIDYIIRKYYILRWTRDEFLKGKKSVIQGTAILEDPALYNNTIFKLDEITIIQGRFSEVTAVYTLDIMPFNGMPAHHVLGTDPKEDLLERLKADVEQFYYSNMYYSPFKVLKRIFSVAQISLRKKLTNEESHQWAEILEKILPFISSPTSSLYQIKSELEAIEQVLDLGNNPKAIIDKQVDEMKFRIPNVISITEAELNEINNYINMFTYPVTKVADKIKIIKILTGKMKKIINTNTIIYMDSVHLNPPPSISMPKIAKYNRMATRSATSEAINPLEAANKGVYTASGLNSTDPQIAVAAMIKNIHNLQV